MLSCRWIGLIKALNFVFEISQGRILGHYRIVLLYASNTNQVKSISCPQKPTFGCFFSKKYPRGGLRIIFLRRSRGWKSSLYVFVYMYLYICIYMYVCRYMCICMYVCKYCRSHNFTGNKHTNYVNLLNHWYNFRS